MIALHAALFSGISRRPASVLLWRIVIVFSIKSTSCQWSPLTSHERIVVLNARVIASRAFCQSGLVLASLARSSFCCFGNARPTWCFAGRGLISSESRVPALCAFQDTANYTNFQVDRLVGDALFSSFRNVRPEHVSINALLSNDRVG